MKDRIMAKTIVIAGAGPGLGNGIAKKFGAEGYRVALIARNHERLEQAASALRDQGIDAAAFPGDLTDEIGLKDVFSAIRAKYHRVDVLFCNAVSPHSHPSKLTALATTTEEVRRHFEARVIATVGTVGMVIPEMIERGDGAILLTTGLSAHVTVPFITPISMALCACRKYALGLHEELKDKGVYVATVALGLIVDSDNKGSDSMSLADRYFQLTLDRKEADIIIGSTAATPEALADLKAWLDKMA